MFLIQLPDVSPGKKEIEQEAKQGREEGAVVEKATWQQPKGREQ